MKIIIDADACPVVDIAVGIAKERNLECILVCDNTHFIQKDGAETVVVDKGADSTDCKIANLTEKGDVVITQDYGLAAMCLARGAYPLHQDGYSYTNENIDALLLARHTAAKVRRAGGRFHTTPKRTREQNEQFYHNFKAFLEQTAPRG